MPFYEPPASHKHSINFILVLEEILNGLVGNHLLIERVGTGLRVLYHFDDLGVRAAIGFTRLEGCDCFLCHNLDFMI